MAVKRTWATGGALLSAFFSSICCVGPLVLSAMAAAGATASLGALGGLFRALVPLRPFFMVLTGVLLGAAFYRVYRAGGACAAEGCDPRAAKRMKRVLWTVAVLAVLFLASPYLLAIGS